MTLNEFMKYFLWIAIFALLLFGVFGMLRGLGIL